MEYVASLSGGKDSLAMVLRLMEEDRPLTKCVFFDTGMEFGAVYGNIERIRPILSGCGCELVTLRPKRHFLLDMLVKPVCKGRPNEHYGYEWCGGCTRWATRGKLDAIEAYLGTLGEHVQYIGIAADEAKRAKQAPDRLHPLIDWGMTESDCLAYCRKSGWNWLEGDVDLYDILDRVSCWCCSNKNLRELRNIYAYLPGYWDLLKGLQSRIDRPFRRDGRTIFDLERMFEEESRQMRLFAG